MVAIREADISDLDPVRSLLFQTWRHTFEPLHGRQHVDKICALWEDGRELKARLEAQDATFLVAQLDQQTIGMAFANAPNAEGIAYLSQLYVLPDYQAQGIGSDLLYEIETSFPDAKLMRLGVDAKNVKAVGFYERFGYRNTNIRLQEGGMEALVFEKQL
ncbi:MAG: GNAT family N-acetyltransferase [Rhizobiaceae bacterium]|nr:GNAT family N-acetyltransferase [Rhizobiaceae bacterium]